MEKNCKNPPILKRSSKQSQFHIGEQNRKRIFKRRNHLFQNIIRDTIVITKRKSIVNIDPPGTGGDVDSIRRRSHSVTL